MTLKSAENVAGCGYQMDLRVSLKVHKIITKLYEAAAFMWRRVDTV